MQQSCLICCNEPSKKPPSPPPSGWPWLLAYDFHVGEDGDQIFWNINDRTHYHCRIPEFLGRNIQGCFNGWWIFSKSSDCPEFSLWNPMTLNHIILPPLALRPFDIALEIDPNNSFDSCCLSSSPSTPDSVVLVLMRYAPWMAVCMLSERRKSWVEIYYDDEFGEDILRSLVSCNGVLYARTKQTRELIRIDVRVCDGGKLTTDDEGELTTDDEGEVTTDDEGEVTTDDEREVTTDDEGEVTTDDDDDDGRVEIDFVRCGALPQPPPFPNKCNLMESCGELFAIFVCYEEEDFREIVSIHLFKIDLSIMRWEEIKTAKDRVFFLHELGGPGSHFSCPVTESGISQGGYIHIIRDEGLIFSYNMEDKTISPFTLQCGNLPPKQQKEFIFLWAMPESRYSLGGDHGDTKHTADTPSIEDEEKEVKIAVIRGEHDGVIDEEGEASEVGHRLVNLPFHIVELIAEHCGVIGYLRLRSTCKQLRLAVSPINLQAQTRPRLRTHSLVSPWLMVMDKDKGTMAFTDPGSGEKYLMNFPEPDVIGDGVICCSRYGWLLIFKDIDCLVFYNPFTRATIHLPELGLNAHFPSHFASFGFSAPPTSPDCLVAGFGPSSSRKFYITSPGKTEWYIIDVPPGIFYRPSPCNTPSFCHSGIYVCYEVGTLGILTNSRNNGWEIYVTDRSAYPRMYPHTYAYKKWYIVECDNDILSVNVGGDCTWVQVCKLNPCTRGWEQVDSLGKHMIYVSLRGSFSAVAKTPGMENKIYFPSTYGENKKNIVFYSLDTCDYNVLGQDKQEAFTNLLSAKQHLSSVWIEPSWLTCSALLLFANLSKSVPDFIIFWVNCFAKDQQNTNLNTRK